MRRAKILIADENANYAVLPKGVAVEEVSRLSAVKEVLAEDHPAVAVIPLDLHGLGGPAGIDQLRELSPQTRIIAVTSRQSEPEEVDVLRHGAKGYMSRKTADALLAKAIDKVREGEIWAGRKAIGALLDEIFNQPTHEHHHEHSAPEEHALESARVDANLQMLTPREMEIVRLLHTGASNKEIASSLNVTVSTVKAHLTSIFRKLKQPDRLRLALSLADTMRGDTTFEPVAELPPRDGD